MLFKELPSSFNLCRSSYGTSGTTCAELDSVMHPGLQGGPGRSFINDLPATYACAPTPTPTSEGLHPALCFGRLQCWGRVAGGEEIEAEARRPWIQSLSNAPAGVQPVTWRPQWLPSPFEDYFLPSVWRFLHQAWAVSSEARGGHNIPWG